MGLTQDERSALVQYRLNKAQEVFTEATDVADLKHWNLAVNRLYYAVFHACGALLLTKGYTARTHSGIIHIILLEYVKTDILTKDEGSLISTLFNMRNTGDYDDLFDWTELQVAPLIEPVKNLLEKLKDLTTSNTNL